MNTLVELNSLTEMTSQSSPTSLELRNCVDELIKCPICLDDVKSPKGLPCFHTFCEACISEYCRNGDKRPGDCSECPVCRSVFKIPDNGIDQLPNNFLISNLAEIKKITSAAVTANVVVPNDTEARISAIKLQSSYCTQHAGNRLELYCMDCSRNFCLVCLATKHKDHVYRGILDLHADFGAKVRHDVQDIDQQKELIERQMKKLSDMQGTYNSRLTAAEDEIHQAARDIKLLIDEAVQQLETELTSQKAKVDKETCTKRNQLEYSLIARTSFIRYCQQLLESGKPCDLTQAYEGLRIRAEELKKDEKMTVSDKDDVTVPMTPVKADHLYDKVFLSVCAKSEVYKTEVALQQQKMAAVISNYEGKLKEMTTSSSGHFTENEPKVEDTKTGFEPRVEHLKLLDKQTNKKASEWETKAKQCEHVELHSSSIADEREKPKVQHDKPLQRMKAVRTFPEDDVIGGALVIGSKNDSKLKTIAVKHIQVNAFTLSGILQDVEIKRELDAVLKSGGELFVKGLKIVCSTLFTLDCDLPMDIWHGADVEIIAEKLCVEGNCAWNLSGNDVKPEKIKKAANGTCPGEDGKDGKQGANGESGGNVTLCCSSLTGGKLLVVSRGGDGGHGQDGGHGADGADGEDGVSLSVDEFKQKFLPICRNLALLCSQHIGTVLRNLPTLASGAIIWFKSGSSGERLDTLATLRQRINQQPSVHFSFHVEGETEGGEQVTVSYYGENILYCRQGFVIFKGSAGTAGQQGGAGGDGGPGGNGGLAGQLNIYSLDGSILSTSIATGTFHEGRRGENGSSGEEGMTGKSGRGASDVGYIDHNWLSEPIYYSKENLQLNYSDSTASDRVWCAYNGKYAEIIQSSAAKKPRVTEEKLRVPKTVKSKSLARTRVTKETASPYDSIRSEAEMVIQISALHRQQVGLQKV